MAKEAVVFQANVPVELSLAFAAGLNVQGRFGDRVMFTLEFPAGKVMFHDLAVSQQINMQQLDPGERFFICKRPKNGSVPARWDVWLSPATEKMRDAKQMPRESPKPAAASPIPARRPPVSAMAPPMPQHLGTGTNGPMPVPLRQAAAVKGSYQSAMTEFLLMAGRATKAAEKTLGAEGGSVRFDSRDVAALATTCFIQAAHDGLLRWRPGVSDAA